MKRIKKWHISVLIIIVGCGIALTNINFKTVDEYNREQAQIADSGVVRDADGSPSIIFENGKSVSEDEVKEAVSEQLADTQNNDIAKNNEEESSLRYFEDQTDVSGVSTEDSSKARTEDSSENKNSNKLEDNDANNTTNNADNKATDKSDKTVDRKNTTDKNEKKSDNKTNKKNETATAKSNKTSDNTSNNNSNKTADNPTDKTQEKKYITCTFEVVCYELSSNPEIMAEAYRSYIPADGVLISKTQVKVVEGTTVYDVLNAACKNEGIAIDSVYDPFYKTYYVRGINNLYEKEAGNMSGWVYTVNGKSPMLGASSFKIKQNDSITWSYTTDGVM